MRARVETVLLTGLVMVLVAFVALAWVRQHADGPPTLPPPRAAEPPPPSYDDTLEPAAAVLALVPRGAASVTVTDLTRIREQLGRDDLTGADPATERDAFWAEARDSTALLTPGLLRDTETDAELASGYGFTEDDVDWEAHFFTPDGDELGWVLRFRDDLDMGSVAAAVDDGVGPLADGSVDPERHLVARGATPFPAASWAGIRGTDELVGPPASSTYLQRGCLPGAAAAPAAELRPLSAYSVAFGPELATARLGAPRTDLFARLDLDLQVPEFAEVYAGGVADPSSGRLGYRMVDPVAAADLALRGQLPFAACDTSSSAARG